MVSAAELKSRLVLFVLCSLLLSSAGAEKKGNRPKIFPGNNVNSNLNIVWPVGLDRINTTELQSYLPMCKVRGMYKGCQLAWAWSGLSTSSTNDTKYICTEVEARPRSSQIQFPIHDITKNESNPRWSGIYWCEANGTQSEETVNLKEFSPPTNVNLTFVGHGLDKSLSVYECCTDDTYPKKKMSWKIHSNGSSLETNTSFQLARSSGNNALCEHAFVRKSFNSTAGELVECTVRVDNTTLDKMCTAQDDAKDVRELCRNYSQWLESRNLSHLFTQAEPSTQMPTCNCTPGTDVEPSNYLIITLPNGDTKQHPRDCNWGYATTPIFGLLFLITLVWGCKKWNPIPIQDCCPTGSYVVSQDRSGTSATEGRSEDTTHGPSEPTFGMPMQRTSGDGSQGGAGTDKTLTLQDDIMRKSSLRKHVSSV